MKLFCFFLFFCVFCSDLMAKKSPKSHSYKIKVMTFNLWHSGTTVINGLAKVVEQIKQAKADIVALQEVYIGYSALFATLLGPEWSGVEMYDGQLDSGIITRHKIDKTLCDKTSFGLGCLISLKENPSVKLVVWSVHLSYLNYPPYIACCERSLIFFLNQLN